MDKKDCCVGSIEIGDDYGDNGATIRCQLKKGHKGPHSEKFVTDDEKSNNVDVTITWKLCK